MARQEKKAIVVVVRGEAASTMATPLPKCVPDYILKSVTPWGVKARKDAARLKPLDVTKSRSVEPA